MNPAAHQHFRMCTVLGHALFGRRLPFVAQDASVVLDMQHSAPSGVKGKLCQAQRQVWPIRDEGWYDVYDALRKSPHACPARIVTAWHVAKGKRG